MLGVGERPLGGLAHQRRRSTRRRVSPGAWSGRCRRRRLVPCPSRPPPGRTRGSVAGTGREVAWATARSPSPSVMRVAASPMRMSPAAMIGLAHSAPPDGLTSTSSPRPSAVAQDQLLVGERRVQLGDVDRCRRPTPAFARRPARSTATSVRSRSAEGGGLDAVVDAADPRRAVAELAGHVVGGEHHGGGAVGDRRAVVLAQRADEHRLGQQRSSAGWSPLQLGVRVVERRRARLRATTSAISSSVTVPASSTARAWSAASDTESGHSGPT